MKKWFQTWKQELIENMLIMAFAGCILLSLPSLLIVTLILI